MPKRQQGFNSKIPTPPEDTRGIPPYTMTTGELAVIFHKRHVTIRRWADSLIPRRLWTRDPYGAKRQYYFRPEAVSWLKTYWEHRAETN